MEKKLNDKQIKERMGKSMIQMVDIVMVGGTGYKNKLYAGGLSDNIVGFYISDSGSDAKYIPVHQIKEFTIYTKEEN